MKCYGMFNCDDSRLALRSILPRMRCKFFVEGFQLNGVTDFGHSNAVCVNGTGADSFNALEDDDDDGDVPLRVLTNVTFSSDDPIFECLQDDDYQAFSCNGSCDYSLHTFVHYRSRVTIEFSGDASSPTHVMIDARRDTSVVMYDNVNTPAARQTVEFDVRDLTDVFIRRLSGVMYIFSIRVGEYLTPGVVCLSPNSDRRLSKFSMIFAIILFSPCPILVLVLHLFNNCGLIGNVCVMFETTFKTLESKLSRVTCESK